VEESTTGDAPPETAAPEIEPSAVAIDVALNDGNESPANTSEAQTEDEPEGSNRREFPRFACEGRAQICLPSGGLLLNGRILDISEHGCFVQGPRIELERGTDIEVSFETKLYKFKVDGNIARLVPGKGVGVLFNNPSSRIIFQIRELISELQMQEAR
jgi:PilZ domain